MQSVQCSLVSCAVFTRGITAYFQMCTAFKGFKQKSPPEPVRSPSLAVCNDTRDKDKLESVVAKMLLFYTQLNRQWEKKQWQQ